MKDKEKLDQATKRLSKHKETLAKAENKYCSLIERIYTPVTNDSNSTENEVVNFNKKFYVIHPKFIRNDLSKRRIERTQKMILLYKKTIEDFKNDISDLEKIISKLKTHFKA